MVLPPHQRSTHQHSSSMLGVRKPLGLLSESDIVKLHENAALNEAAYLQWAREKAAAGSSGDSAKCVSERTWHGVLSADHNIANLSATACTVRAFVLVTFGLLSRLLRLCFLPCSFRMLYLRLAHTP